MATYRTKRYRAKYTVEEATKRAKKLLPVIYPSLEQALIDWDMLEQMLFLAFEELGVLPEEYEFYLAWAKRKAEKGLRFRDETRRAECEILMDEFVIRGLDRDILEAIEPVVDEWLDYMWGILPPEGEEVIINGGFETGDFTGWTHGGKAHVDVGTTHSGVYSAHLPATAGVPEFSWIDQYEVWSVPKSDIVKFGFWYMGIGAEGCDPLHVLITFDDYSDAYVDCPPVGAYTYVDLKDLVPEGRSVIGITFSVEYYIHKVECEYWIDDVTLRKVVL